MYVFGCKVSTRVYDYSKRVGISNSNSPPIGVSEAKVKVINGLKEIGPQMSFVTPYHFDADLIEGQVPGNPNTKRIRIQLYHDWTDAIVKDGAVLTLRLTPNGELFDIKEFLVTQQRK